MCTYKKIHFEFCCLGVSAVYSLDHGIARSLLAEFSQCYLAWKMDIRRGIDHHSIAASKFVQKYKFREFYDQKLYRFFQFAY